MSSLHAQYLNEIQSEQGKLLPRTDTLFTETDVCFLPIPVQRYFRSCGYIGTKKLMFGQIRWKNVQMRLSPRGHWKKMRCSEFLAAPEPMRIAHMKTKVGGLLCLEAKDQYNGGHGNILVRLAGMITLQDAKGEEMDASGLLTVLSECLLLPACALQLYIRWEAINRNMAAAVIRFRDTEVRGVFYFNDRDEFIRFETEDRWKAGKPGEFTKVKWMVTAGDYIEENGMRKPGRVTAAWVEAGKIMEYFKGEIEGICSDI